MSKLDPKFFPIHLQKEIVERELDVLMHGVIFSELTKINNTLNSIVGSFFVTIILLGFILWRLW